MVPSEFRPGVCEMLFKCRWLSTARLQAICWCKADLAQMSWFRVVPGHLLVWCWPGADIVSPSGPRPSAGAVLTQCRCPIPRWHQAICWFSTEFKCDRSNRVCLKECFKLLKWSILAWFDLNDMRCLVYCGNGQFLPHTGEKWPVF